MILIRDAGPLDAESLRDIYAYYVENTAISFEWETPTVEAFRGRMETTLARYPYLVLEEDGAIRGYAYAGPFKGRAAYDWSCEMTVYLARDARGRGLGQRLYEAMEAALGAMGIRNLYACIAWPEEEDEYLTRASADFHARRGYKTVGTFRNCANKFGRWYHMIWMEKVIGPHEEAPPSILPYPELR